jgi:phosphomannomutase
VGGDFRRSTPAFKAALSEGLGGAGLDVIDVGQGPTPLVYFAARHLGVGNAAIVTASHNPGRYNGIKFLVAGRPAIPEAVAELQSGLEDLGAAAAVPGTVTREDLASAYEAWLRKTAGRFCGNNDADSRFSVVVDVMAGATSGVAPRVLAADACQVLALRDTLDPDFASCDPDPSKDANLQLLSQCVVSSGADLGLALDGDGDRAIFVDEAGRVIRPEQIGALLACRCFERPTLVYDLKCASVLPRAIEAAGGTAIMQPSGHGFIKTAIIDRQADLGVEVSGHHFYGGDLRGADDGLLTALIVCRLVRQSGRPLSQWIEPYPWPAITPDLRIRYDGDAQAAVERIAGACGGRLNRMDGVRAEYETGWALARASITEPAITLRFEGRDWQQTREIAGRFLAALPELRNHVLEFLDG